MSDGKAIHTIDIENIIRNKNPRLLKFLPSPVIRYIKHVIHEKELNAFLHQTKDCYSHDFVKATLSNFQIEVNSFGLTNIPEHGGCIIVCNHPLGGLDGIAVLREVGKVRPDIKALVNDLIMNLKNLNDLLIPVNKHGKNSAKGIKLIDDTYASEGCTIVFPAGLVSRKQQGLIKDLEWKKSFITKAIKHKRCIIPIYVDANNSNFFYRLAQLRKLLRVKANIEMFYLVDEVFKQRGKKIQLTIGQAIPHTYFSNNYPPHYWAQQVKEHVYSLRENKAI